MRQFRFLFDGCLHHEGRARQSGRACQTVNLVKLALPCGHIDSKPSAPNGRGQGTPTASLMAGSLRTSSTVEGSGILAPSSTIPAMWRLRASAALRRASSNVLPAVMQPGKSGKLTPKSESRVLMKIRDVVHTYLSLMLACRSILLRVPIGMFRFGCGTVTRPFFTGCLNCTWLPT